MLLRKHILVNTYPEFDSFAVTASKQQAYIDMLRKSLPNLRLKKFMCNQSHLLADSVLSTITLASNLGYLAPPGKFVMGAKLLIGTP